MEFQILNNTTMRSFFRYSSFLAFVSMFTVACTEVIDIDLNKTDPKLVIQAEVSTAPGPYYVKINQTVNFDTTNDFPPISNATVIISDDAGNIETLNNLGNGNYSTNALQGVLGRTYTLEVIQNGNNYTAVSTIPSNEIMIDTIIPFDSPFGSDTTKFLIPIYKDPSGIDNYYRFKQTVNGIANKNILLLEDRDNDGNYNTRPLFGSDVKPGDDVTLEIQGIDKGVYTYLSGFLNFSGGFNASASPANPTSNIIGTNVLGFFSAHTSSSKHVVVQ